MEDGLCWRGGRGLAGRLRGVERGFGLGDCGDASTIPFLGGDPMQYKDCRGGKRQLHRSAENSGQLGRSPGVLRPHMGKYREV